MEEEEEEEGDQFESSRVVFHRAAFPPCRPQSVEEDFVDMRKDDPASVSAEDLHRLLVVARWAMGGHI